MHERKDIVRQAGEDDGLQLKVAPLEQCSQPVNHVAGALLVLADVGDDGTQLLQVRNIGLQEQFRRFGVAQNRAERLIQLVRKRGGEFPHGGDATQMGKFLDVLPRFSFCALALGDVDSSTRHAVRFA